MKLGFITVIAAALLFSGCGILLGGSGQSSSTSSSASTSGSTYSQKPSSGTSSIMSTGGYRPTSDDVSRYGNDVSAFLKAVVPNFNYYKDAAIVVNSKVVSSLSGVRLSDIKTISVLDKAPSLTTETKSTHGAIVITTK